MARTVDPVRHAARRLVIIDASITCLARRGYAGATTAEICRTAGVGSGTFFHYFPTKLDVLLGILELGTAEQREWFAARAGRADGLAVVHEYVAHTAAELTDPRVAGFVRAVGAVMSEPKVDAALRLDSDAVVGGLSAVLRRAQAAGEVRTDLPPERLARWVQVVLDGVLDRMTVDAGFDPVTAGAELHDVVHRLLAPRSAP
ncbi:MAG: TetR/AcrR family transcriptional regulator [Dermatophilaceae bacterium]